MRRAIAASFWNVPPYKQSLIRIIVPPILTPIRTASIRDPKLQNPACLKTRRSVPEAGDLLRDEVAHGRWEDLQGVVQDHRPLDQHF